MFLSADQIAIANRSIRQTFEQTSVAWQAVPHWDVGDPAQTMVRNDAIFNINGVQRASGAPFGGDPITISAETVSFRLVLAQAISPTPDALLAAVTVRTVDLSRRFDTAVLGSLWAAAVQYANDPWYIDLATGMAPNDVLPVLVRGRQTLEDNGYRASSCLIASTLHFNELNQWMHSNVATEGLLVGANANSVHRASQLDDVTAGHLAIMIMLGRRQEIAHGCAATASPGEEPVDIAVSVPPSLEVVGEDRIGQIVLAVRIRFATRVKDERAIVVFHADPAAEAAARLAAGPPLGGPQAAAAAATAAPAAAAAPAAPAAAAAPAAPAQTRWSRISLSRRGLSRPGTTPTGTAPAAPGS
jgi:hypothetical protein